MLILAILAVDWVSFELRFSFSKSTNSLKSSGCLGHSRMYEQICVTSASFPIFWITTFDNSFSIVGQYNLPYDIFSHLILRHSLMCSIVRFCLGIDDFEITFEFTNFHIFEKKKSIKFPFLPQWFKCCFANMAWNFLCENVYPCHLSWTLIYFLDGIWLDINDV